MNKFLVIALCLAALKSTLADDADWEGPVVLFDEEFYGCGARIAGSVSGDAPVTF
jgi:hypothetical protein